MKKAVKIILLIALAIGWMYCIFKLSGMASSNSNGKSVGIIGIFIEDALDITNDYGITNSHPTDEKLYHASKLINAPMRKVIHASVYFVLAFFVMMLASIIFDHKHYFLSCLMALVICMFFAITDEFHQTFVDGRTGQILDVVIDTTGAFVGVLFYSTYQLMYRHGYKSGLKEANENKLPKGSQYTEEYNNSNKKHFL